MNMIDRKKEVFVACEFDLALYKKKTLFEILAEKRAGKLVMKGAFFEKWTDSSIFNIVIRMNEKTEIKKDFQNISFSLIIE